jgi:mRNA interferase RelE/StbE
LATRHALPVAGRVQGEEDAWRIRVGEYRVLYEIKDATRIIDIVAVRHRRDAYR